MTSTPKYFKKPTYFFFIRTLDTPGPPGQPEAIAATDDSITLQWSRPISDGGSPIQGYVLEKKEEGTSNWVKCAYGTINDIQYKVILLKFISFFCLFLRRLRTPFLNQW